MDGKAHAMGLHGAGARAGGIRPPKLGSCPRTEPAGRAQIPKAGADLDSGITAAWLEPIREELPKACKIRHCLNNQSKSYLGNCQFVESIFN